MRRNALLAALAVVLSLAALVTATAASQKPIETFTAFAASLGTGRTAAVEIAVDRWSTDDEREMLLTTLQEFGPDRLLQALEKIRPPVGYVRRTASLAWDLYYARNNPMPDGGRHIVLATNRRVSFREAARNTRSMQYQFTLIELHIDASGKGEGKMVPAARVSWDHDAKRIEIENYNALPVDLLDARVKSSS